MFIGMLWLELELGKKSVPIKMPLKLKFKIESGLEKNFVCLSQSFYRVMPGKYVFASRPPILFI